MTLPFASAAALRDMTLSLERSFSSMQTMSSLVRVFKPAGGVLAAVSHNANGGEFECNPVALLLPERANAGEATMCVVFTGRITIIAGAGLDEPSLTSYATNFGYFRLKSSGVVHVLGGHYDFALGEPGHPHAHVQLKSQIEMWDVAAELSHRLSALAPPRDAMIDLPSRLRVPTAQMDFLSFLVQLAADHLVDKESRRATLRAFAEMSRRCEPFSGCDALADRDGHVCERGGHWYH